MSTIGCGICFLQYNERELIPRMLTSCGHTVCQQCAVKLSENEQMITCPFDKIVTRLNRNGSRMHKPNKNYVSHLRFDQHKSHEHDFLMDKLLENQEALKKAVDSQKLMQEGGEMMVKIATQLVASYDVTGEEFKNAVKIISDQFDNKKKEAISELTQFANEKKKDKTELKRGIEKTCSEWKEFDKLIVTLKVTNDLQSKDKIDEWKRRETSPNIPDNEFRSLKEHEFIVSDMKLQIKEKSDLSIVPILEQFESDMKRKYPHLQ